jgi:DNA topoisomerase VI subunit B
MGTNANAAAASDATTGRTAFVTDRGLEFLTESELTTQLGYGRAMWPLVLVKELIDNALDACESADVGAPQITIALEADALTVTDNGPGLKPAIVGKSLDYRVRISDKKYYVAPTRGQLGRAQMRLGRAFRGAR